MGLPSLSIRRSEFHDELECDLCYGEIRKGQKCLTNEQSLYCLNCINKVLDKLRRDMEMVERRMGTEQLRKHGGLAPEGKQWDIGVDNNNIFRYFRL